MRECERAHNPCLGSQQFDLADGGGAVVEPELAALYLLLALAVRRIADRVFEAPHSDLAVAAPGDDAATEREEGGEGRVMRTYMYTGERGLSYD